MLPCIYNIDIIVYYITPKDSASSWLMGYWMGIQLVPLFFIPQAAAAVRQLPESLLSTQGKIFRHSKKKKKG